jgi:hypothetical protein
MSVVEIEQRRSRHAQGKHRKLSKREREKHKQALAHKRKQRLDALPATLQDGQVLTFFEWCALNRIGERTGRRLLASGNGPVVTQLTEKRIGITIRANREWQQARERA